MSLQEHLKIKIREATIEDVSFVTATWLNSQWSQGHIFNKKVKGRPIKTVTKTIFFDNHARIINQILEVSNCYVCCAEDDDDLLYGYIVFSKPNIIHFAYVKGAFRRLGIFDMMIREFFPEDIKLTFTQDTKYTPAVAKEYEMEFNPYEFYRS